MHSYSQCQIAITTHTKTSQKTAKVIVQRKINIKISIQEKDFFNTRKVDGGIRSRSEPFAFIPKADAVGRIGRILQATHYNWR